jgi:hypothetical protein
MPFRMADLARGPERHVRPGADAAFNLGSRQTTVAFSAIVGDAGRVSSNVKE